MTLPIGDMDADDARLFCRELNFAKDALTESHVSGERIERSERIRVAAHAMAAMAILIKWGFDDDVVPGTLAGTQSDILDLAGATPGSIAVMPDDDPEWLRRN